MSIAATAGLKKRRKARITLILAGLLLIFVGILVAAPQGYVPISPHAGNPNAVVVGSDEASLVYLMGKPKTVHTAGAVRYFDYSSARFALTDGYVSSIKIFSTASKREGSK